LCLGSPLRFLSPCKRRGGIWVFLQNFGKWFRIFKVNRCWLVWFLISLISFVSSSCSSISSASSSSYSPSSAPFFFVGSRSLEWICVDVRVHWTQVGFNCFMFKFLLDIFWNFWTLKMPHNFKFIISWRGETFFKYHWLRHPHALNIPTPTWNLLELRFFSWILLWWWLLLLGFWTTFIKMYIKHDIFSFESNLFKIKFLMMSPPNNINL